MKNNLLKEELLLYLQATFLLIAPFKRRLVDLQLKVLLFEYKGWDSVTDFQHVLHFNSNWNDFRRFLRIEARKRRRFHSTWCRCSIFTPSASHFQVLPPDTFQRQLWAPPVQQDWSLSSTHSTCAVLLWRTKHCPVCGRLPVSPILLIKKTNQCTIIKDMCCCDKTEGEIQNNHSTQGCLDHNRDRFLFR